ncbi:MAG: hypothetical protein IPK19_17880 [Chloroflexi bacterium]|nr:hypothetical protein [Chloroflexota bacterium]
MRRSALLVVLLTIALLIALLSPVAQAEIGTLQEPPYEPTYVTTYEPPIYATPIPSSSGSSGGPTDSRLNYTPDEYFTVYCAFDMLEVWRGIPTGALLDTISLLDLLSMSVGELIYSAGDVSVQRDSQDTYTIFGSNGNLAPVPGSKSFSMSACIAANGGAPEAPPAQQPGEPVPEEPDYCDTVEGRRSESCYSSEEEWCVATNYSAEPCTQYNLFRLLGFMLTQAFQCWGQFIAGGAGLVFAAGGLRWYTRRK